MMDRLSTWAQRHMPTREQLEKSRWIRPFAHRVLRAELWRFTRRSVPRGVALGLAVGIIVPFAQILFASLLALPVRANVPVAALTTFVTNPFTTPFLWLLAYKVGEWLLRVDAMTAAQPVTRAIEQTDFDRLLQWLTVAPLITAFGLLVIAVVSSALSYVLSGWAWRWWIARKRLRVLRHRRGRRGRSAR